MSGSYPRVAPTTKYGSTKWNRNAVSTGLGLPAPSRNYLMSGGVWHGVFFVEVCGEVRRDGSCGDGSLRDLVGVVQTREGRRRADSCLSGRGPGGSRDRPTTRARTLDGHCGTPGLTRSGLFSGGSIRIPNRRSVSTRASHELAVQSGSVTPAMNSTALNPRLVRLPIGYLRSQQPAPSSGTPSSTRDAPRTSS